MKNHRHTPYTMHNFTNGRTRPTSSHQPSARATPTPTSGLTSTDSLPGLMDKVWLDMYEDRTDGRQHKQGRSFNGIKATTQSLSDQMKCEENTAPQSPHYIKEKYIEDMTEPRHTSQSNPSATMRRSTSYWLPRTRTQSSKLTWKAS